MYLLWHSLRMHKLSLAGFTVLSIFMVQGVSMANTPSPAPPDEAVVRCPDGSLWYPNKCELVTAIQTKVCPKLLEFFVTLAETRMDAITGKLGDDYFKRYMVNMSQMGDYIRLSDFEPIRMWEPSHPVGMELANMYKEHGMALMQYVSAIRFTGDIKKVLAQPTLPGLVQIPGMSWLEDSYTPVIDALLPGYFTGLEGVKLDQMLTIVSDGTPTGLVLTTYARPKSSPEDSKCPGLEFAQRAKEVSYYGLLLSVFQMTQELWSKVCQEPELSE